ncbi:hypothetical protein L9F63_022219, partial [Diploptera punctata]
MDDFKRRPNELSLSRVKTIMKSSPDVEKSTEMFLRCMAEDAHEVSGYEKSLEYEHVADLVHEKEELCFLREIVPLKLTLTEIEEYQRENGLKIERPGTYSTDSEEISYSSDDDDDSDIEVGIPGPTSVTSTKSKATPSKDSSKTPLQKRTPATSASAQKRSFISSFDNE